MQERRLLLVEIARTGAAHPRLSGEKRIAPAYRLRNTPLLPVSLLLILRRARSVAGGGVRQGRQFGRVGLSRRVNREWPFGVAIDCLLKLVLSDLIGRSRHRIER